MHMYMYLSLSLYVHICYTLFFSFFLEEMKCDSCPSPQVAKIS